MAIDLEKCREFMIAAHAGQTRSNGKPFNTHPINVMERLRSCGITDEVTLATALLHDVVEDTTKTEQDIIDVAGIEVATAVMMLTNKADGPRSFAVKTVTMLEHARHYNDVAKRVKLADRYDNLADAVWEWKPEIVKRYARAGIMLLDIMTPFPADVGDFAKEARRFFECLV